MISLLVRSALFATLLACAFSPQTLLAATSASFTSGTLNVSSDADDSLTIDCLAGNVRLNGGVLSPAVACASVEQLTATGGPGANAIDLSGMSQTDFTGLLTSTLAGGLGTDTVVGSFASDVIVWNPGDGSDTNDGGAGNDRIIVIGSDTANTFTVGTAGAAPGFDLRFIGPFTIDIVRAEVLEINARGGDDNINASGLPAGLIALQITGGTGNDTIIGSAGDDTNIWNNGDNTDTFDGGTGSDLQIVNGAAAGDVFTVQPAAGAPIPNSVLFRRSNLVPFDVTLGNTERLQVNGLAGDDSINAGALPAGLIALEIVGGTGTDTVVGSAGDDRILWNPGDGSDTNDGGAGNDRIIVNGSDTANTFTAGTAGAAPGFDLRFIGPFTIDIVRAEVLEINARGGDDNINASGLPAGLIALEIVGGTGTDTVVGSAGNDAIIWNPGDGSDTNDGGAGNDRIIVNGSDTANTFTAGTAGAAPGFDLRFIGPFTIDIVRAEVLEINARGGDDNINASDLPAGLIAVEIVGGTGTDTVVGSAGNDAIIWNPGDGSDTNDGGVGNDRIIVNGSDTTNTFTAGTAGAAPGFDLRFIGPFTIDIVRAEVLEINARGGDDNINASGLPAGLIALEIVGGTGTDTVVGSAGDDRIIWNPGDGSDTNDGGAGNDRVVVNGSNGANTFTVGTAGAASGFALRFVGPFTIDVRNAELLEANGNGGDDIINASALPAGLISLQLNGGDGNDTITGGAGDDTLRGGANNDNLIGFLGIDQVFGDAGEDVLVWNPGDGTDLNDGGEGTDISRVLAAGAAEAFSIAPLSCSAGAPCARARRTLPSVFDVDIVRIERLELLTGGGRDTVSTEFLPGVLQVLDGGSPTLGAAGVDFFPVDELRVAGVSNASASPVVRPGFGNIEHSGFEFAPTMALAAQGGETGHTGSPSGDQEVPPVNTSAEARGSVVLSRDGSRITVRLAFSGLSSANTMSHIHGPAAPGSNGPVIFNLGSSGSTSGEFGPLAFAISEQQRAQLLEGLWYFNIHSSNHPAGEIRGQILMDQVFEAQLSPQQVVGDAVVSQASGSAKLTLAGTQDNVVISLNYAGLTGEGVPGVSTSIVLRGPAPRGSNGPALADFPLRLSAAASDSFITQEYPITADEAQQLKAGQWYIEVSSQEFPNGELRGQLDNILFCSGFEDSGC